MRFGAGDGIDYVASGIQGPGDPLDVAALACRIPAFIGDDHGDLLVIEGIMQGVELLLQFLEPYLVLLFRDLLVQGDIFQPGHGVEAEDVLTDRRRHGGIGQGRIDALIEEAQDLEQGPLLIVGIDDIPGSGPSVRILEIAVVDLQTLLIVGILPQILLTDPPGRIGVGEQAVQPFLLLLLPDMEEEFHDQISVVHQLTLCDIDGFYPLVIFFFGQFPVQDPVGDFLHPAGIKELEFSLFRDLYKVPVKEGFASFLLGGRLVHGGHLEEPGVYVLDDLPQDASLAGRAPAFKDDHDGKFCFLDLHLAGCELFLFLFEKLLHLFLIRFSRFSKIS